MEDHFICTGGCKGVSDKPGICQARSCRKHREPLEACNCKDGKHYGREDRLEIMDDFRGSA